MNAIEIQNVTKTFREFKAVDDLSLNVPQGSIYGFIGPNGSGKTTTIRMIMNILFPDSGIIKVAGKIQTGSRLEKVGYLPEERGLYKKMKVRDLLYFHAELKNIRNIKQETDYWLEKFNLTDWASKKALTLSKGMSQKLQFIITVIDHPEIIILDEPFSGLDPVNAVVLREVILELQQKGTTVIFSTHDMNTAEKMCDYIFMIYKGRKVLDGTLAEIQQQYGSDSIRIQSEMGRTALDGIAGIENILDYGREQELRVAPSASTREILTEVLKKTNVLKFELAKPSLNDIFIRIARPDGKENGHE